MLAAVGGIVVETRPWHGGHSDFFHQIFRKFHVVGKIECGDVGHDVIRAARDEATESGIIENGQQSIAAN